MSNSQAAIKVIGNDFSKTPTDLFIGGEWVQGSEGKRIDVIDPSTEKRITSVADATVDDAIKAVDAAHKAAAGWAATPPRQRSEILRKAYEVIMRDAERFAKIITLENGKSLTDSRGEVAYAAEFFRWFAEEAVRNNGQVSMAPSSGCERPASWLMMPKLGALILKPLPLLRVSTAVESSPGVVQAVPEYPVLARGAQVGLEGTHVPALEVVHAEVDPRLGGETVDDLGPGVEGVRPVADQVHGRRAVAGGAQPGAPGRWVPRTTLIAPAISVERSPRSSRRSRPARGS